MRTAQTASAIVPTSLLTIVLLGHGCTVDNAQTPGDSTDTIASVYITDHERLVGPAPGDDSALRPIDYHPIDSDAPSSGEYAGFYVSLATSKPEGLTVRLTGIEAEVPHAVTRVDAPAWHDPRPEDDQPVPIDEHIRALLLSGQSAFYETFEPTSALHPGHRLAIVIPRERLTPTTTIEFFADTAADGTPLRSTSFPLVNDFFIMAVIGDSIQWGNGLEPDDKFSAIVANTIQDEVGARVVRQVHAHSGAHIVPVEDDKLCQGSCWGEVPTASTPITWQVDQIENPEKVDLVLMDGCINDVDVMDILDPLKGAEELESETRLYCGAEMETLIEEVREKVPNAKVVVTAYFQIIGESSDILGLEEYATVSGLAVDPESDDQSLKDSMVISTELFDRVSRESLAAAVDAVNARGPATPVVAFAPVSFGADNNLFGPESWLWDLTNNDDFDVALNVSLELFPEDPVLPSRLDVCLNEPDIIDSILGCIYTSAGHPNVEGARQYADSIIAKLRELGVLADNGG